MKLQSQLVTYWILNVAGYLLYRSLIGPSMIDCTVFLPLFSNRGITSKWNSQVRQLHKSSTDFSVGHFCMFRILVHPGHQLHVQMSRYSTACWAKRPGGSLREPLLRHCWYQIWLPCNCPRTILRFSLNDSPSIKDGWSILVLPFLS